MAVLYSGTLIQARLQAVVDEIGVSGKFEITTSGGTLLASMTLLNPAGTLGAGTIIFASISDPLVDSSANATGTAALARIRTNADVDVVTGLTVGTSGTDVILESVDIEVGQVITVTSAVINHA